MGTGVDFPRIDTFVWGVFAAPPPQSVATSPKRRRIRFFSGDLSVVAVVRDAHPTYDAAL
jgi:hypothetical protein